VLPYLPLRADWNSPIILVQGIIDRFSCQGFRLGERNMSSVMTTVYPLTACDLIVGAPAPRPKRQPRKPSFTSIFKAARRAGADHVRIGETVIAFAGETPKPTGNGTAAPDSNEWDDVLPGGDRGAAAGAARQRRSR
jgi:hypothetical protein